MTFQSQLLKHIPIINYNTLALDVQYTFYYYIFYECTMYNKITLITKIINLIGIGLR